LSSGRVIDISPFSTLKKEWGGGKRELGDFYMREKGGEPLALSFFLQVVWRKRERNNRCERRGEAAAIVSCQGRRRGGWGHRRGASEKKKRKKRVQNRRPKKKEKGERNDTHCNR